MQICKAHLQVDCEVLSQAVKTQTPLSQSVSNVDCVTWNPWCVHHPCVDHFKTPKSWPTLSSFPRVCTSSPLSPRYIILPGPLALAGSGPTDQEARALQGPAEGTTRSGIESER